MFKGLSAFPLTPLTEGKIAEKEFTSLLENLVHAGVDSIGALGSTGSYAYLTREQRRQATELAVSVASGIPVMTSIGAIRSQDVFYCAEDAQRAGVKGVLLAPVSYQEPTSDEAYSLYEAVTRELSVPLCVYDNPATTGFYFSDELLISIAALPNIGSVKLGYLPPERENAVGRLEKLRRGFPADVTIGISGDGQSAEGLLAGCDAWYSVIGGLFPRYTLEIARAAIAGRTEEAQELNNALRPLWAIFQRHGSLRVIATIAEVRHIVQGQSLPFPLKTLQGDERDKLAKIIEQMTFLR